MFSAQRPVVFPADTPPKLLVVIDTEEEFDWHQPARRESTGVSAMKFMDRVQDIFLEYGICPCYVIDYPVASQPEGYQLLKEYAEAAFLQGNLDYMALGSFLVKHPKATHDS